MKKILLLLGCAAAAFLAPAAAAAAPAQVILIRHAEKPGNSNELSAKGFERAEALVWFFQSEPAVTRYGTPVAIYAMAQKDENSSVRAIQTVKPLAKALQLRLNTDFTRDQTRKLVRDIMENPEYAGRMVLVCWQHTALVEIAAQLAAYNSSSPAIQYSLPGEWNDSSFDRVWVLDLSRGKVTRFQDLPQRLLPGDSF
ncbi:MAG: histidine phosphatase family protein [Elusimicrobiales bacterium]|nr:histidine phosphatase family protein [Elusimicrobiales bacterium]